MFTQYLLIIFVFIFTAPLSFSIEIDPECRSWFKKSQVNPGSQGCELKCSALMVDMNTFICPDQCPALCKLKDESSELNKFIFYPGLTPSEKNLVEKYPKDALTVFVQKNKAESSSSRNFPTQGLNDEGDAFRHYIWAGLLTSELGPEKALLFLEAHENNSLQPTEEKAMDTANNRAGILAAQNLLSDKSFDLKKLEQTALDALRERRMIVLNPGLPIPKEPK